MNLIIFNSYPPPSQPTQREYYQNKASSLTYSYSPYHHVEKLEIPIFRIANCDFNIVREIRDDTKWRWPSGVMEESWVRFIAVWTWSRNHLSSVERYFAGIFSHPQLIDILAGGLNYLNRDLLFLFFFWRIIIFILIFVFILIPIDFSLIFWFGCFLCDQSSLSNDQQ